MVIVISVIVFQKNKSDTFKENYSDAEIITQQEASHEDDVIKVENDTEGDEGSEDTVMMSIPDQLDSGLIPMTPYHDEDGTIIEVFSSYPEEILGEDNCNLNSDSCEIILDLRKAMSFLDDFKENDGIIGIAVTAPDGFSFDSGKTKEVQQIDLCSENNYLGALINSRKYSDCFTYYYSDGQTSCEKEIVLTIIGQGGVGGSMDIRMDFPVYVVLEQNSDGPYDNCFTFDRDLLAACLKNQSYTITFTYTAPEGETIKDNVEDQRITVNPNGTGFKMTVQMAEDSECYQILQDKSQYISSYEITLCGQDEQGNPYYYPVEFSFTFNLSPQDDTE